MKKIRFIIFILFAFGCAYIWLPCDHALADETGEPEAVPEAKKGNPPDTLISMKGTGISGYGGIYSRYSQVGDTTGWLLGGRGCVIINDRFAFGAGAMGLVSPRGRGKITGNEYSGLYDTFNFGYGGFLTEYYINPKNLIVFSFGTLVGGGQLSFSNGDNDDDGDHHSYGRDKFFVVEPEANVFVNITRFCRAGIGVSYRYVSGIHSKEFEKNDFNGPAASAMIQFGWF